MRTHQLKIWPEQFEAVLTKNKKHEIRINDRGYEVGDLLELLEWSPVVGYSTRSLMVRVTHLTIGGWGLPDSLCVMSICTELEDTPKQALEFPWKR